MLGGTDPLNLDVIGFRLLSQIDPRLKGKHYQEIPYLDYAANLALGDPQAQPVCL